MGWREQMMNWCGPGCMAGVAFGDWVRLLREQRSAIEPRFLPRVWAITFHAVRNSSLAVWEKRRFAKVLDSVVVQPPVFILGHWRSGTTFLHNLLAQDPRFAVANTYQTAFPHIFLSMERFESRLLNSFFPRKRPMDNMELSMSAPQEDEFALCVSTFKSPCMAWVFPRQREQYQKYLTLRDVSQEDLRAWQEAFMWFLKKLQLRHGRTLVLKSPTHTARVRLLLRLFPGAKFVHIRRNPLPVFLSTRRTFQAMVRWHRLQREILSELDDWVLRQYAEVYCAFLEEKDSIPRGSFGEIAFEDLEQDPMRELARIYKELDLPNFSVVEPRVRTYAGSLKGYRKNPQPEIAPSLRERIDREWKPFFKEWGYSMGQATG